jgi:hypothetical protein
MLLRGGLKMCQAFQLYFVRDGGGRRGFFRGTRGG